MSAIGTSDRFMLTRSVVGKPVGFAAVEGEVVSVERWTETQVSTANGSVHVYGNQVSVNPPKVWAKAVGRKAIWIKTADDEVQVPVPEDLHVRQGHRVQAVISTGLDNGASQWAAIVNCDTNRWTQVDEFPPSGCYDPWTGVVMGFGQAMGHNPANAIMWLYMVVVSGLFVLIGQSWWSLVWGFPIGIAAGLTHAIVGAVQAKTAASSYAVAVKDACDGVFASIRQP
jgi:hypothetical protein